MVPKSKRNDEFNHIMSVSVEVDDFELDVRNGLVTIIGSGSS